MSTTAMSEWWDALSGWQQLFWGVAVFFSLLSLIQYIGAFLGATMDTDADGPSAGDHAIDPGFTWLSLRSIIAFFTFFAWTGVILLAQGKPLAWVFLISFLAGMLAMSIVVYLLYLFAKQTQVGNYRLEEALYQTAEVYLPIPGEKKGAGLIHIRLAHGTRELGAVTEGKGLPTGGQVRVIGILDDGILLVEPYIQPVIPT